MSVLGMDTATRATTVALLDGEDVVAEARDDPAAGERPAHAARLLALVEDVLARSPGGWEDVTRIAVGVGPGSFTGLRIGVATARGLALARGIELVGVSTLEALAEAVRVERGDDALALAVLDARRGEAFAAAWRGGHALAPAAALGPEELADRVRALPATPLAVGDGALAFRDALEHAGAEIPADASPLHRVAARHLCRLAAGRDATDRGPEPDYVRAPDAQRPIQSP